MCSGGHQQLPKEGDATLSRVRGSPSDCHGESNGRRAHRQAHRCKPIACSDLTPHHSFSPRCPHALDALVALARHASSQSWSIHAPSQTTCATTSPTLTQTISTVASIHLPFLSFSGCATNTWTPVGSPPSRAPLCTHPGALHHQPQ